MITEKRDYPNCIARLISYHFSDQRTKLPIKVFYCSTKKEIDNYVAQFDMSVNTLQDKLPSSKFIKFYYVAYGPITIYKANKDKKMEYTATDQYRIYYTEIK